MAVKVNPRLALLKQIVEPPESVRKVVLRALDTKYRSLMRRQFATQGAAGESGLWAPLKEPYRTWKQKHYPGRKILVRTGAMRKAFVMKGSSHIARDNWSNRRWSFILGAESDIARYHQQGTPKMAARRMHDFSEPQKQQLGNTLREEQTRQVAHLWKQLVAWKGAK